MRKQLTAPFGLAALAVTAFASVADAKIFLNDTFRIAEEAVDSFGLFINDRRATTISSTSNSLSATLSQAELQQFLLANNNLDASQAAASMFTAFLPKNLGGMFTVDFVGDDVALTFDRSFVERNGKGTVSFKYKGPEGSDRNFVRVTGKALLSDDAIIGDSRGDAGPFYNDTLTITKSSDVFMLNINGMDLTSVADTGGDITFTVAADAFKTMVLANNGVSGKFLGDETEFFDFLAKGNSGLIDVTLGTDIEFTIDRDFVLNEESGQSSFKYNAGGNKKARNFVNFVGQVSSASPSS